MRLTDEHDNDCAKLELPGLTDPLYLEWKCWCRSSSKKVPGEHPYDEDGKCTLCKDTGYAPTDAGRALLKFLKRHS